jgi:hypothetical protein
MQKKSTLGVLKARHEGFSPRREHYNAIRNELLARENVIRVKIPKVGLSMLVWALKIGSHFLTS